MMIGPMPELPEIQAHAERLTTWLGGVALEGFRPLSFTTLKTYAPPPEAAVGKPLGTCATRGKFILLPFGDDLRIIVHLMQGGRLRLDEKKAAKPRGGLARFTFADKRALLFTEAGTEHKAGVWVVAGDPEPQDPLDGLGPDADTVSVEDLAQLLKANPMRLHGFLREQHLLAGLGRRLANEVCHRAKLSPFASTAKLTGDQVAALHAAIGTCIDESLAFERTQEDMVSSAERPGNVHRRAGQTCPVCGDVIRAVEYVRYTVNYCATCQTGGKVLADNTTSKFLK
jgi:formamidopyrimidine-DNA glycosylase